MQEDAEAKAAEAALKVGKKPGSAKGKGKGKKPGSAKAKGGKKPGSAKGKKGAKKAKAVASKDPTVSAVPTAPC